MRANRRGQRSGHCWRRRATRNPTAAAAAATPTPTATHMGTPGGAAGGEAAEGCGGFSGTAALVAGAGGSADGDAGPSARDSTAGAVGALGDLSVGEPDSLLPSLTLNAVAAAFTSRSSASTASNCFCTAATSPLIRRAATLSPACSTLENAD
eukprot:EG_transcript_6895